MHTTERGKRIALYVMCLGVLMIVLDATVVNVALPSIQKDLGFSNSSLAWIVNAYMIAFGGFLLLSGRLGDLLGRRNMFLTGLGVFCTASMLCGLAQSQEMLVVARFLQGAGGAMTSAVVLGMIVTMFQEPREQAKAIGVYAFVASAGGAIGLLAGGLLTEFLNWHWIFFINVPIGLVTIALSLRLIERDAGIGIAQGADVPGAILITSALMLGVYTIVKPAAEEGWTATATLVLGILSLLLLGAFILRQATATKPLMPLRIFKSRNICGANLIQIVSVAGMFGVFFLGSLYMQRVLEFDALEIGLAFLPVSVIMGVLSVRYSEGLIMRFGGRKMVVAGMSFIFISLVLLAQAPADGNYWAHVLPSMALMGTGAGTAFPALMGLAMSGVEPHDAGVVSGLVNTTAQVGGALGLAVLATVAASRTETLTANGYSQAEALTGGYHVAFWIASALVAIAIGIALTVLKPVAVAPHVVELDEEKELVETTA